MHYMGMLWFNFTLGSNLVFLLVLYSLSYITIHQNKGNTKNCTKDNIEPKHKYL